MKHKLMLDALSVESFEVESPNQPAKQRGTVRAHGTGGGITCGISCITCYESCWGSCEITCFRTCPFSCPTPCQDA